jgi:chromosome partitioning protein
VGWTSHFVPVLKGRSSISELGGTTKVVNACRMHQILSTDVAQCSNRNTLHNVPVGTFQRYVPTGTFNPVFQPEHSKPFLDSHTHPLSNSNIQDAINVPTGTFKPFAQTSIMKNCASVPTGTLDTFCTQFNFLMAIRPCIRNTNRTILPTALAPRQFMGRVIAVANQKGGVGKTTTAINLAASFAAAEVNTLLIDCDPQSNATSGLGLVKDPERISTYHLLLGAATGDEALSVTGLDQLWLIPSHKNLIGANLELVEAERREYRLREAIAPLRDRFKYIVLDCPPALDLLTLNALVAADSVLIPMQAEYFALEGISELLDTVERIRVALNPGLEIEGVVLTMLDERTNLAQQVTAELRKFFGDKVCAASIPRNIRLAEAPSHGKPALMYDPRSRGAESYIRLAKELLGRHLAAAGDAQAAISA